MRRAYGKIRESKRPTGHGNGKLILEHAEEPLHGRVARAAPLFRHRSDQTVFLADGYPAGPQR